LPPPRPVRYIFPRLLLLPLLCEVRVCARSDLTIRP
jgi:hypothetical protein